MRKAKNQWINRQCKEIEDCFSSNRTRRAYKIVKRLTKTPTHSINAINNKDGRLQTEASAISNRWHEYCIDLYSNKHTGDDRVLQTNSSALTEPEPHILEGEVLDAINSLPNNKAPGIDNIPGELLKSAKYEVIPILTQICNKILRDKSWPKEWTQSVIIPLPKKGNLKECKNYRTISLISHPSKVMRRIILNRLQPKVEEILSEEQAGFRRHRSTTEQTFKIRVIIEKYLHHRLKIFSCFIDFKKAFD